MKLLYIHQYFTTPNGSGGIRSYEMAKKCVANGIEVTLICGSQNGGETGLSGSFKFGKRSGYVDGIFVIELELNYSNNNSFFKRSVLFLKYSIWCLFIAMTYKYDIIFATSTPLTVAIPGIFAKWLRGKKFVFEVRDLWPELPKAMGVVKNPLLLKLMKLLELVSYKSADKIIGLSPGICFGIISNGISSEKVIQIPNGCDIELFSKNTVPWRPDSVDANDILFIFCGTHGIANGLDTVLDAVKELNKLNINGYKILLVGSGKLKNSLINRVKKEELPNIIFLNPMPKMKLIGLLKSCDIGMQILSNIPAFYYGTSPNKFFDYLSAKLPVITNYPGWIADLILYNKCGFACKPSDSIAFAKEIINVINNKSNLKSMGEAAYKLANNEFNRDVLSDKWVECVIN